MKKLILSASFLAIAWLMAASNLVAQEPAPAGLVADLNLPPSPVEADLASTVSHPIRFASLDGGPVIVLDQRHTMQLSYGFAFAHTWGDTIAGLDQSYIQSSSSYMPYLAVSGVKGHEIFLAQYAGTFTDYSFEKNLSNSLNSYHSGQFSVIGNADSRLSWTLSQSLNYGNGVLRSIAPISTTTLGGASALDPTSADLALTTDTVFGSRSELKLDWRQSRAQTIHLSVQHAFYQIQNQPSHMNEMAVTAQVDREVTRRWSFDYYGQVISPVADPGCVTLGGGLGVEVRFEDHSLINLQGGPEWTRAQCDRPQGLNYSVQYLKQFSTNTAFYATAGRQRTVEQNISSTLASWEDLAAVGLSHDFAKQIQARADWGYSRGNVLHSSDFYSSNFVSVSAEHQMASFLFFDFSYRNYYNAIGQTSLNRNAYILQVSFKHDPSNRQ